MDPIFVSGINFLLKATVHIITGSMLHIIGFKIVYYPTDIFSNQHVYFSS